ncbi:unnamed protein product [Prorocentrum cordatum]|uniref:Uncharacterized protein n=1 Tax=Prorocentrum cordatum TaxID=2364126 RepID=A0ABN9PA91_9DINO|nr:unnamed protein product [Polarella glacialis]
MAPGASRSPRPCRGAEVPGDPGGAAAADAASAAGGGWSAVGWRSGGAWGDGAWGEGGDQWSDSGWQGGCGGAWGEGEDQWSSSSWQGGGGGQGEEAGAAAGHEEGWEPWYIDAHDLALQPRGQGGHRFRAGREDSAGSRWCCSTPAAAGQTTGSPSSTGGRGAPAALPADRPTPPPPLVPRAVALSCSLLGSLDVSPCPSVCAHSGLCAF